MTGLEEFIPLIIAAGGTAASMYGQQQAANDRRDILNKQLQSNSKTQEKTNQMIGQEGEKYAPEARKDALDQEQATTLQQEQADLGTAPDIIDTAGDTGNVSSDFLNAKAEKALSEGDRLTAIARELSKTRAPGSLLNKEGLRRADLTGELGSIWGSQHAMSDASGLDAQAVEPPWYTGLGQIATAAAGAYGGGGKAPGTDYSINPGGTPLGPPANNPYWGKPPKLGGSSAGIKF